MFFCDIEIAHFFCLHSICLSLFIPEIGMYKQNDKYFASNLMMTSSSLSHFYKTSYINEYAFDEIKTLPIQTWRQEHQRLSLIQHQTVFYQNIFRNQRKIENDGRNRCFLLQLSEVCDSNRERFVSLLPPQTVNFALDGKRSEFINIFSVIFFNFPNALFFMIFCCIFSFHFLVPLP